MNANEEMASHKVTEKKKIMINSRWTDIRIYFSIQIEFHSPRTRFGLQRCLSSLNARWFKEMKWRIEKKRMKKTCLHVVLSMYRYFGLSAKHKAMLRWSSLWLLLLRLRLLLTQSVFMCGKLLAIEHLFHIMQIQYNSHQVKNGLFEYLNMREQFAASKIDYLQNRRDSPLDFTR